MSATPTTAREAITEALSYWRETFTGTPSAELLTNEVIACAANGPALAAVPVHDEGVKERRTLDRYRAAAFEWAEKTQWVHPCAPHELGLHLADVMRQRVERAESARRQAQEEREAAVAARDHAGVEIRAAVAAELRALRDEIAQLKARDRRDSFIAAALAGISAHATGPTKQTGESASDAHARWAVSVANAVMRATR